MRESPKELNVDLGERSYPIFIGQQLLGNTDLRPGSLVLRS